MPFIYLVPPLLLLAYLTARKTRYGLYVIFATVPAFLFKTSIWFIPTTWLELAIFTVSGISIIKHIKRGNLFAHFILILYHIKRYTIPSVLLLIAVLISILFSSHQLRALGILKGWFIAPMLLSLVFLDKVKSKKMIPPALLFLSLSAWPIMLYGLYEYIKKTDMTIPGRLDSFFTSPNYVALYLVPLIILVFGFIAVSFFKKTNFALFAKREKMYLIFFLLIALVTVILSQSFGGFIGLIAGAFTLVLMLTKITKRKIALFSVMLVAGIIGIFILYQKSDLHFDRFWGLNSLETRRDLWKHSIMLLSNTPILGMGLGDFQAEYKKYVESLPKDKQPVEREVLFPHNIILAYWLETGLLGVVAFIWIIVIFTAHAIIFYRKQNEGLIVVPAFASLVALIAHGVFDTPYFKNDLSLLFWFIVAINIAITLPRINHAP